MWPDGPRPTAAKGAGRTETGTPATEPQVKVHLAPFIRKSSVCVAHSQIGPGRSSLTTDTAARRSQPSTRHISGGSISGLARSEQTVTYKARHLTVAAAHVIRFRTSVLSFLSCRFSFRDFEGFLEAALRGDLSAMSAPFRPNRSYSSHVASVRVPIVCELMGVRVRLYREEQNGKCRANPEY